MRKETQVGLFVTIGILMLFLLSTQVGSFHFGKQSGYIINVSIKDANGLEKNAKVKSRGINIGTVQSFSLNANNVNLTLLINQNIKIPQNSIASIKQESMLGVKYVDIEFSSDSHYLGAGGKLTKNKSYASFDETSDTINKAAISADVFIKKLNKLITQNEKNFNTMIANFKDISDEFKTTGKTINKKLPSILDKFETVGDQFATTGKTINQKLPAILDKFDGIGYEFNKTGNTINKNLPAIMTKFEKLEDDLQGVVTDNRKNLKSAIKNIDTAFATINGASKKVESSFDKFDKYLSSTTNSTLGVEFKSQYMVRDSYNKTYFDLDYSPKPTRHYMLDVISSDDYSDDGTGRPTATKLHEKGKTLISVQYGKDIKNTRVRGGIIQSTGGIGVDYFALHKKLKLSLDAFDFNAYNDIRGDKAHLTFNMEYLMKKHILLYTGYDNFLNNDAKTVYFGLGVKFEDNDLKYLLGSSAAAIK